MKLYQKAWVVAICVAGMLLQSTGFIRGKLDAATYQQKLFRTYLDGISYKYSTQNRAYDPERVFRAKLATNSYSQKILVDSAQYDETPGRENATILMLVRNWELDEALRSMRSLEDRFNSKYHYVWTFLNDVPFDDEFIEATSLMASGETQYGLIPPQDWNVPSFINQTLYEQAIKDSIDNHVIYGHSKSYRNMCRFNSGFFYRQELVSKYDYYFRVEPGVEYYCDFQYDPFRLMRENNKKYGFIISIHEYEETIPTLYDTVMDFFEENEDYLSEENSWEFIKDQQALPSSGLRLDVPNEYNLCHFWSNFEIADLNFFRSKEYQAYFDYLDSKGGFYYERWGDAPVHTLAATLLLKPSELHYFEDIGYFHAPFASCPSSKALRLKKRCQCDPKHDSVIDVDPHSCIPRWWKVGGKTFLKEKGVL